VAQDLNQQCYHGNHLTVALALGVPGIILFCAGVPLGAAALLAVNRKRLRNPEFAGQYRCGMLSCIRLANLVRLLLDISAERSQVMVLPISLHGHGERLRVPG
jgi:hypothetical protein